MSLFSSKVTSRDIKFVLNIKYEWLRHDTVPRGEAARRTRLFDDLTKTSWALINFINYEGRNLLLLSYFTLCPPC